MKERISKERVYEKKCRNEREDGGEIRMKIQC